MSKAEIDRLEIVISADDKEAQSKLNRLIETLDKLGNAGKSAESEKGLGNIAKKADKASASVNKIADAMNKTTAKRMGKVVDSIDTSKWVAGIKNGIDGATQRLAKITEDTTKQTEKAFSFDGKAPTMQPIDNTRMATEIAKTTSTVDLLKMKLDSASASLMKLMNENATGSKLASAIENVQKAEQALNNELQKPYLDEQARRMEMASASASRYSQSVERTRVALRGLGSAMGKVTAVLSKPFLTPFSQLSRVIQNTTKHTKKLFANIKRVAMYRALRASIRMVTEGIKTGIDNAYQWSIIMEQSTQSGARFKNSMDNMATSALYLKNSFGAMAMPLINILSPAIDFVVDKFVTLLNVINRLIATLSGASTWTRALRYPKAYGEALDDASGSAGKLADELITILGIDEINPMEGMNDKAGRGGGAGGLADDYGSMFEEVALEGDKLSEFLGELFDPFARAWENKGQRVIDAWNNAFGGMKELIVSVGNSFWEVWTNGTGQRTVEHLLGTLEGILNTVGNIAGQFAKGWNTDNLGTDIIQNIWDMLNDILGMWEDISLATADWAKNLDFEPILRSFRSLTEVVEPVVDMITDGLAWAYKEVLLPFGKWAVEDALPAGIDLVTEAVRLLKNIMEKASPYLKTFWDEFGKPARDLIWQGIVDGLTNVKDTIADLNAVLEGESSWNDFWGNFADRISGIVPILGTIIKAITQIWDGDWKGAWNTLVTMNGALNNVLDNLLGITEATEGFDVGQEIEEKISLKVGIAEIEDEIPTAKKKIAGFIAKLFDWALESSFVFKVPNMIAEFVDWDKEKSFSENIGNMVAKFKGWDKEKTFTENVTGLIAQFLKWTLGTSFGVTIGGLTAGFRTWSLESTFGKVISGLIAGFTGAPKKEGGFSSFIGGLTAGITGTPQKENQFNSTIGGMTATFVNRALGGGLTSNWSGWTAQFVKRKLGGGLTADWSGWKAIFTKRGLGGDLTANWSGWKAIFTKRDVASNFNSTLSMVAKIVDTVGTPTIKANIQANKILTGDGKVLMVKADGGSYYSGRWHDIPQYASGGMPDKGSMFIAGEAGAELVGHIGGHTEVLNQSQLASAMAGGMAPQTALLQELVNIGEKILAEQGDRNVVVSTSAITEGFQRMNRREGRTVVPVGV